MAKLSTDGSTLLYATFLGGGSGDSGSGIVLDANGNAVVTGRTFSSDFPTTPGAFDTSHNGSSDIFVSWLSADGSTLLHSTFLGGRYGDRGLRIAAGAVGTVFVTGGTASSSSTFPATPGAFDTSYNGGSSGGSASDGDAFVAKISLLATPPVCRTGMDIDFATIQETYDAAVEGDTIQCQAGAFVETVYIDQVKSIRLEGGYDSAFAARIGNTALIGSMNVANGVLTMGNFIIK